MLRQHLSQARAARLINGMHSAQTSSCGTRAIVPRLSWTRQIPLALEALEAVAIEACVTRRAAGGGLTHFSTAARRLLCDVEEELENVGHSIWDDGGLVAVQLAVAVYQLTYCQGDFFRGEGVVQGMKLVDHMSAG